MNDASRTTEQPAILDLKDEELDQICGGEKEEAIGFPGYEKTATGIAESTAPGMKLQKAPSGADKEIILIDEGR
jgi:hypothetical protein